MARDDSLKHVDAFNLVNGSGSRSWQGRVRVQRDVLPHHERAVDDAPQAADFTCHRRPDLPAESERCHLGPRAVSARSAPTSTSPAVEEKTGGSALDSLKTAL